MGLPAVDGPRLSGGRRRRRPGFGGHGGHRARLHLKEFASHPRETFEIDIVSEVPAAKRRKRLDAEELAADRVQIGQHEFDYTVPAYLAGIDPTGYDNVLLLRSEKLKTSSESDARTILAHLLLRQLTAETTGPHVLMELTDPDNSRLFEHRLENEQTEIVVTSRVVSHIVARVALRRELRCVFDELFSPGGCDIVFRRGADYDLAPGHYLFADLQQAVDARGDIAIGLRRHAHRRDSNGGVLLNPGRDERLDLAEKDELVVLSPVD